MTLPFLFCRKHTIQCMSRFWHLPSRVGNAYDYSYFGTKGVLKTCFLCPVVTVATRCWWLGNQQGLIFSHFLRCHNCGGSLSPFFLVIEVFNPCKKHLVSWVLFDFLLSAFFLVSNCTKKLNYRNSTLFLAHSKIFVQIFFTVLHYHFSWFLLRFVSYLPASTWFQIKKIY